MDLLKPLVVTAAFSVLSGLVFFVCLSILKVSMIYSVLLSGVVLAMGFVIAYFLLEIEYNEMRQFLFMVDDLLGKVPHAEVEKFSASKNFELYEKTMKEFKVAK